MIGVNTYAHGGIDGWESLKSARGDADATGKIVWSQDPKEFSERGNIWPMVLCEELARTLTAASDLHDQAEPGPLETQLRRKHEISVKNKKADRRKNRWKEE